jgi:hypothetical protein
MCYTTTENEFRGYNIEINAFHKKTQKHFMSKFFSPKLEKSMVMGIYFINTFTYLIYIFKNLRLPPLDPNSLLLNSLLKGNF